MRPSSERRRYAGMITGMRRGPDGYALERNTRYTDHWGGNKATAAPVSRDVGGDTGRWEIRPPDERATPRLSSPSPPLPQPPLQPPPSPPRCERAGGRAQGHPGRRPAGGRGGALPLCRWRLTHRLTGGPALRSHGPLPQEMLAHLLSGWLLNGWVLRQTLEACATYACAVGRLTSSPYASTEYAVISGVRKGTILARGARCDGGLVPSPLESERAEGESGREPRERES